MKAILRKIFPLQLKLFIKKTVFNWHVRVIKLFSISGITASFYYFLFSRKFDREHLSVLKGKVAYDRLDSFPKSSVKLRRNIHRLEKGLIMRPRRTTFALDYIQETVDSFCNLKNSSSNCESELKWAQDVLFAYFEAVENSDVITKAREKFQSHINITLQKNHSKDQLFKPYPHRMLPEPEVETDSLEQLLIRRRSVRWYREEIVPFEMIQKAVDLASSAPSACNRQPYRFIATNNKTEAVTIAKCAGGTKGFAENFPSLIVVVGNLSAYPDERDRHLIYIDSALATMQLILALETMGLSSCPINWPDIDSAEQQIQNILNIKPYERVIMLLAVGYADENGGIPYSQKKNSGLLIQRI